MARSANFILEIRSTTFIKSVILNTLMRLIIFYIVLVNFLFLLYLTNINKLGVFFNNITNQVIQLQTQLFQSHLVIQRYRYTFLLLHTSVYTLAIKFFVLNTCYLTNIKLRYLCYHFKYLSVYYLHQLLEQSRHDIKF